jgi:hypothetical protein
MKRVHSELLLLDVNVLLALAWPNHQFHAAATHRLELEALTRKEEEIEVLTE